MTSAGDFGNRKPLPSMVDLLRESACVLPADLDVAVDASGKTGQPVEKVLLDKKLISQETYQSLLLAHTLIYEDLLGEEDVINALCVYSSEKVPFAEALARTGFDVSKRPYARLGKLLCEAGWITDRTFLDCLQHSQKSGNALGRVLVAERFVSGTTLSAALESLMHVEAKTFTWLQAVEVMGAIRARRPETQPLTAVVLQRRELRPVELLATAGVITDADHFDAIERGLAASKAPGVVLVESAMVDQGCLDAAVYLQSLFSAGTLSRQDAGLALRAVHERKVSVDDACAELRSRIIHSADVLVDEEEEKLLEIEKQGVPVDAPYDTVKIEAAILFVVGTAALHYIVQTWAPPEMQTYVFVGIMMFVIGGISFGVWQTKTK